CHIFFCRYSSRSYPVDVSSGFFRRSFPSSFLIGLFALTFVSLNLTSMRLRGLWSIRRQPGLNCNLFNADFPPSFLKVWSAAGLLMPTYEYSCQKCDQTFEAFQSMRDEPFRECPKELCRLPKWGHGKVKRLLGTGAGLIFKGSGFYSTDYRSESYKAA